MCVEFQLDVLGKLEDLRPKEPRPSFRYLFNQPSTALANYWRTALIRQAKILRQRRGDSHPLLAALKDELRTVDEFERRASESDAQAATIDLSARHGSAPQVSGNPQDQED